MNEEKNNTKIDKRDKPLSPLFIAIVPIYGLVFVAICIFPIATWSWNPFDWTWIEGWGFIIVFAVWLFIYVLVLNKKNPRVLRNRMKIKKEKKMEEEKSKQASASDKWILPLFGLSFFLTFIITDLDHLFNWSVAFPIWLEIIGFVLLGIGLYLLALAQLQNAYASKVLDIREGQKLIDTGLYANVRHPIYSGFLVMVIGIPIGLGSWWAIIPAIGTIFGLIVRIKYEEEMLLKEFEGYKEYRERVKYKLIPKIY
ncbi:MAG: methyltransferase family protein [Candidatus Hermodarchaeota archaeon]